MTAMKHHSDYNGAGVLAIIQARMSSDRLPGKVLAPVQGKPLLLYVIERVKHARFLTRAVVATSQETSDDPVADLCDREGVPVVRGSLRNVASRFIEVLEDYPSDAFVRICGDSPMLDQNIVDQLIYLYRKERPDIASNSFKRSYPVGMSCEVVNASTYRKAYPSFCEPEDFEHVTRYFHAHADLYRIVSMEAEQKCPERRLSVDQPEDLEVFRRIVSSMQRPHWTYGWTECLELKDAVRSDRDENENADD